MCCQCTVNVLGTWGVNFPTHWFNLRITCSMPSCLSSGFSQYFLDSDDFSEETKSKDQNQMDSSKVFLRKQNPASEDFMLEISSDPQHWAFAGTQVAPQETCDALLGWFCCLKTDKEHCHKLWCTTNMSK